MVSPAACGPGRPHQGDSAALKGSARLTCGQAGRAGGIICGRVAGLAARPADPLRTKSDAVSGDGFVGLLTGDVVGVHDDWDVQGAEVVFDEGFDG